MSDAASNAAAQKNLFGGILGGLDLGAKVGLASLGGMGGLTSNAQSLRNFNGQAEWKPFG